ncbi:hypothetical protein SDC9_182355 [bioreactor metagenome]|uniref:Uncharacterized protein n=1 Tax=bioreactor metagenome TaxID=1076179 RepID=A0A645H764_9ZZZZ
MLLRSVAATAGPVHQDRPYIIEGAAVTTTGTLAEGHRHLFALLPHPDRTSVLAAQFDMGLGTYLTEVGKVEAATAAARDVDRSSEAAHLGITDVQACATAIAGLVLELAVSLHIERAYRHRLELAAGGRRVLEDLG